MSRRGTAAQQRERLKLKQEVLDAQMKKEEYRDKESAARKRLRAAGGR